MLPFNALSFWEKEQYTEGIEVLIVGAGIVGLSTAIHLKKLDPKLRILIVERGILPTGGSTKNAGFACIGSASEIIADLENNEEEKVWEIVDRRWRGLTYLKELMHGVDIGYKMGNAYELFRPLDKVHSNKCKDQLPYLNDKMKSITGMDGVYKSVHDILPKMGFNGFDAAFSNAAEGQLDTGKLMQALHAKAIEAGVRILNGISVEAVDTNTVNTNMGELRFEKIAICTNGLAAHLVDVKVEPARAQVLITSPIEKLQVEGSFHFHQGYYYFRSINNRILFGGGRQVEFEKEMTSSLETSPSIQHHLEDILRNQILPNYRFSIEHRWAGTMGIGISKVPVVRRLSDNLFCAVRMGGMGVAIGSQIGRSLAQLIEAE